MIMPTIGDAFIPTQVRLVVALLFSVLIAPLVSGSLPPMPVSAVDLGILLTTETVIGLFLGTVPRLMFGALDIAGMIIALNASLSNAAVFNPALASQASLPGAMLGLLGLLLVFVTNLHHMLFLAIADSYTLFVPGAPVPIGDFADMVAHLVSRSFLIGIEMSSPFMVAGLLVHLASGLLARLVPQIQVFFVFMSSQVAFGLLLLALTLSAMMLFWLRHFQAGLIEFLNP
ncbi:MAG: flagellar biosynthetic protein FliR [Azospirillum sp.]|nr:flagellar biosynthetic protein FliR [Azospirillum sp.]